MAGHSLVCIPGPATASTWAGGRVERTHADPADLALHRLRCGLPCLSARPRLLAEFDGAFASLWLYLAGQFVDACADLPHASAGPLHDRFLGWLRASA